MTGLSASDERALAAALFNGTWDLLERADRGRDGDDRMLHMAHASRYHWGNVGTAANLARGEWMCSRVYAVLGRAEPATAHARRTLDLCEENGLLNWDLAFAYEALARAAMVAHDAEAMQRYLRLAREVPVAEAEERELLAKDLATIG